MFSSSGRDTSSWVHTEGQGRGRKLAPACPVPCSSSLGPCWPAQKLEEDTQAGCVLAVCEAQYLAIMRIYKAHHSGSERWNHLPQVTQLKGYGPKCKVGYAMLP